MKKLIKSFSLLSDETKLRTLNILQEEEGCVCEVRQALGITQSAASRSLTGLYDAGFLKLRKDGLWSLYSIDRDGMQPFQKRLAGIIIDELKNAETAIQDRKSFSEAALSSPRALLSAKQISSGVAKRA
jgi:ArsR family transcriptional regulator, arsenate/arsenite/antimonite-responsive transcriptional repressor